MLSAFLAPGQGLSKNHNLERCMPSARREDGEVVRGLAVGGLHGDLLGLEDLVGRRDADPDLVDVRRAELERERRAEAEKRDRAAEQAELRDRARDGDRMNDVREADLLRAEQQHAYKRGDQDAVRRIQRKLDALAPEKADAGPKHPWA